MAAESKIEKYLRTEIALLGGWMEKHVSPGTKGPPDNLVMWGPDNALELSGYPTSYVPLFEFIETKAPGGRLSVLQRRDHKRRREMGFTVHVIWNFEQAESYLHSRGKK